MKRYLLFTLKGLRENISLCLVGIAIIALSIIIQSFIYTVCSNPLKAEEMIFGSSNTKANIYEQLTTDDWLKKKEVVRLFTITETALTIINISIFTFLFCKENGAYYLCFLSGIRINQIIFSLIVELLTYLFLVNIIACIILGILGIISFLPSIVLISSIEAIIALFCQFLKIRRKIYDHI